MITVEEIRESMNIVSEQFDLLAEKQKDYFSGIILAKQGPDYYAHLYCGLQNFREWFNHTLPILQALDFFSLYAIYLCKTVKDAEYNYGGTEDEFIQLYVGTINHIREQEDKIFEEIKERNEKKINLEVGEIIDEITQKFIM